jgi:hypothetical protein
MEPDWLGDYYNSWLCEQQMLDDAEIELNTIAAQQQEDYQ